MADAFFGSYLLGKGLISLEQLHAAVQAQKHDRLLLGQIAVNQGMITETQLQDILEKQHRSGLKFGQIAREQGLLSEEQFRMVLEIQASNHVLLGEALVRKGFLSPAILSRSLHDFEMQQRGNEQTFLETLSRHGRGSILKLCLDMTRSYLGRLGYATKCVCLSEVLPAESGTFAFYLEQTAGQDSHYLGIHLSRIGMRTLLGEEGEGMTLVHQHEEIAQLLFNLNYIICEDLRKQGLSYKHGAVQSHAPLCPHHLNVRLASFIDNLDVSYSFF